MENISNPYAPPESNISDPNQDVIERIAIYTPFQVGLASFLCGPISAIYMLSHNYSSLDRKYASQNVLIFGFIALIFLIWLGAILPPQTSTSAISLFCTIAASQIAKSDQLTKEQILNSSRHHRYSSWNVFIVCLVSIILYFTISLPIIWLLRHLNAISPA